MHLAVRTRFPRHIVVWTRFLPRCGRNSTVTSRDAPPQLTRVALTVEHRWGQTTDVMDQADVSVACLTLTQLTQLSFYDLILFLNDN